MANLEDFDALVAELIQGEGEKKEPVKDEGFQLHLGGKDYKFGTREEAERALETHMARLEQSARTAAERVAALEARPEPTAPEPKVKEGEVPEFTKRFVKALEEGNPKDLARLLLRDGVFDGKIEDPASVLTDSLLRTAQLDRNTAVQTFLKDHPELATNNAAASAVEQARQFLALPATPDGFEAAHAFAERRGLIQRSEPGTQTQQTRSGPPAPPRAATTGNGQPQTDEDWERFYNSRSDEELEKLMKTAYAQR